MLFEAEEKITDMALESSSAKLFPKDTVLMAMYGDGNTITSLGLLAKEAATNQACCAMIPDRAVCDSRFLFYALRFHRDDFIRLASGGAQRNLSGKLIRRFAVNAPPLPEQRAIAHILGTLDDKIELNRRMNETLEAMARALFKSWFVDFDPVRAKHALRKLEGAEGRPSSSSRQAFPGLPKPLADLFPDSFEDSELGEIPKGWEVKTIGDFIERLPVGQKYEEKTVSPIGEVPVLDQGKSGVIGYHNDKPGVIASADSPVAVFANHTCYMRLVSFPFSAIQNVLPFTGKNLDTVWAFFASHGKQSFIEYKGHWPDFVIHKTAVPPSALTEKFSRLVHPLVKGTWMREDESRDLAALRDMLLPKLISGELRVNGTERLIEERIL